jgi:hypothetical protein
MPLRQSEQQRQTHKQRKSDRKDLIFLVYHLLLGGIYSYLIYNALFPQHNYGESKELL